METKRNAISNRGFDFNLCGSRSVEMTINPESIFVVRGFDVNGNQKGETERRQTSEGAAELARYMLDSGCRAIDIDVLEPTGQTCQNG